MTRARDLAAFVSNADGDIKFDTDTLFIDSSANRVGIGTTTVDSLLHIKGANPEYRIEDNNETGSGNVVFRDSARETAKISVASGSSANMQFQTLGTEAMRITSPFDVAIGTTSAVLTSGNRGNLTISGTAGSILNLAESGNQGTYLFHRSNDVDVFNTTNGYMRFGTNNAERMRILAGGGLTFNGDTAAANALDDYEEGTWTPVIGGQDATVANCGHYTKIGRKVLIHADFTVASGASTGNTIGGLPFAVFSAHSAWYVGYTNSGAEGGYADATSTVLKSIVAGGTTVANLSAGHRVILAGHYTTTA